MTFCILKNTFKLTLDCVYNDGLLSFWNRRHREVCIFMILSKHNVVALSFSQHYKRSDWCFCACAINVKLLMGIERTMHLWYNYYGLFIRMHVTSLQSYLSQINSRQTSFEHVLIASVNHVTVVRHNPWQWFRQTYKMLLYWTTF